MAEWKESPEEFFVLVWQEMVEVEAEGEEEAGATLKTDTWIFRTEAEMRAFVIDEILEKVRDNEDQLPPATVRDIREAAAQGKADEIVGMWVYLVERLFEGQEFVMVDRTHIMSRS
jgi:hypothetical protein